MYILIMYTVTDLFSSSNSQHDSKDSHNQSQLAWLGLKDRCLYTVILKWNTDIFKEEKLQLVIFQFGEFVSTKKQCVCDALVVCVSCFWLMKDGLMEVI